MQSSSYVELLQRIYDVGIYGISEAIVSRVVRAVEKASARICVEHVNSKFKTFQILTQKYRNFRKLKSTNFKFTNPHIKLNRKLNCFTRSLIYKICRCEATLLKVDVQEIEFKNVKQYLASPVDGYIGKLMVHTVGGVVTPAEKLISIIPKDVPLVIKATVMNQDIGFIKEGMDAAIKIDTFDFQKYGLMAAKVNHIFDDATDDEKLGPVYELYLQPEREYLEVSDEKFFLNSGMSVTAELNVGNRRIIEFFMYPLIKYLNEGMNVR